MGSKLDVIRAIAFVALRRALGIVTIILVVVFGLSFLGMWALAHFVSGWWWLLLVIWVPLLLISVGLRVIVGLLAGRFLWRNRLSDQQKSQLNAFVDKLQSLAESRGLGWPVFIFLNIKDIVLHRDFRTTKKLVTDSTSLKRDFEQLERLFR